VNSGLHDAFTRVPPSSLPLSLLPSPPPSSLSSLPPYLAALHLPFLVQRAVPPRPGQAQQAIISLGLREGADKPLLGCLEEGREGGRERGREGGKQGEE